MGEENGVHVMVGTRKGAYVLEGDPGRRKWKVRGPFHEGRDVFQVVSDPRGPGVVYAAANSPWWGPMMYRSENWGRTWTDISVPQMPKGKRKPPAGGEMPKYPVVNVWQIAPGRDEEPDSLLVGIDPASLWRSEDAGESWVGLKGLNEHPTRSRWNPGAGGLCLHTILRDPSNPKRLYAGISAAGGFRSEDDGAHWTPVNAGVIPGFLPPGTYDVGQCIHKLALEQTDPSTIYRQDHDGIYVSHNRGDRWTRVGKPLDSDFGFVVATAPAAPRRAFFVPLRGPTRTTLGGQLQIYRWDDAESSWTSLVPKGTFPGDHGTHRDALATDRLDPAGIYLGTTAGLLYWSANEGKSWGEVPYQFPGIHSVTVASPSVAR